MAEDELVMNLKKENATLKEKVEVLLQQGYETRKNLATSQVMKSELENEIEELQINLKQYEERDEKMQYEDNEITKKLKSKVQSLEIMLQEKEESSRSEIERLQTQLAEIKNIKLTLLEPNEGDISIYKECLSKTQDQVDKLSEEVDHYKAVLDVFKTKEEKLEKVKDELINRLDEVSSLLQAKNEEHRSCLQILQVVKEENALLTSELATLKAPAADVQRRGNSLFAEVEDNRQVVQAKFSALKAKYESLKKTFSVKNIELSKLKSENLRLINELRTDKSEAYWSGQIAAYKERISDLQETINYYSKRPENPQIVTIDATNLNNLQWVTTVVENARQEVRQLRKEMEVKSVQHCFDSENHNAVLRENRQLKYQTDSNTAMISDLKSKLEESQSLVGDLKLQLEGNCTLSPPVNGTDQLKLTDCKQKKIRFAEDTKDIFTSVKCAKETKENIYLNQ